ncbi:MAG: hypothetical protein ACOC6Q_03005 [Patescibacteria group bacterium]
MSLFNFLFGKTTKSGRTKKLTASDKEKIRREWQEIENLINLENPSSRKEALIRADKVVDLALRRIAVGNTMGERLKNAQEAFSSYQIYDDLWKAHKIRNAAVHETGFEPMHAVIKHAINQYKAALKDLGVSI